MVEKVENPGKWPWETGDMPEEPPKVQPQPEDDGVEMYTLPKRKARRGEDSDANGMRPLSAKERAAQIKGEDDVEYFSWR